MAIWMTEPASVTSTEALKLVRQESSVTRFGFVFADGQIGVLSLRRSLEDDKPIGKWQFRRVRENPASDNFARQMPVDGGLKDGAWKLAVRFGAATNSFAAPDSALDGSSCRSE